MLWQHLREGLVDAQFGSDPAGNLVRVPGQHCHTHALLFEQRDLLLIKQKGTQLLGIKRLM